MSITILGHSHNIFVDPLDVMEGDSETQHLSDQFILKKNLSKSRQEAGILHEIIEELNFSLEFKLPHPIIMALESNLYAVLKENGVSFAPLRKAIDSIDLP